MAAGHFLSELKIPADPEFITVAKRVASSLGSQLGFSLEELDELGIAVAQACDSTMEDAREMWGPRATVRLTYSSTGRGIAVDIEAHAPRSVGRETVPARPAPAPQLAEQRELARDMVRLFVDDVRHHVDSGRGQIRFRMVKYLIS